jgi:hypothetical protein
LHGRKDLTGDKNKQNKSGKVISIVFQLFSLVIANSAVGDFVSRAE